MNEYHKIQTVFKRDPATNHKTLLEGEYSEDAFGYLADNLWEFTEKVDGMNIRVMYNGLEAPVVFAGKTDKADLPGLLVENLGYLFPYGKMVSQFGDEEEVCLYGEGYGGKIQKGSRYQQEQTFVLFDVKVGSWWMKREVVKQIAASLGIQCVPVIVRGTLHEMVHLARKGIVSSWGDFPAEGIVARPVVELVGRNGRRVITKIKCKDFNTERA